MEAITLPVYNTQGKEVETFKLDQKVFDGEVNSAAIYQAVNAYRALQRKGLASTKTRGEVSGGGRKPWRQKGTGRARVGSSRNPLWRHGGVVFGPHPRDFGFALPQKIKSLALKSSLNAKVKENNFIILDKIEISQAKTKEVSGILASLKVNLKKDKAGCLLLLPDKTEGALKLALRNLHSVNFNQSKDTHAYEVLACGKLIITKDALNQLVDRLKK
jgi:large subunit ribosomal protein L4